MGPWVVCWKGDPSCLFSKAGSFPRGRPKGLRFRIPYLAKLLFRNDGERDSGCGASTVNLGTLGKKEKRHIPRKSKP